MIWIKALTGLAIVGLGFAVIFGAIIALPVMWLWNGCLVGALTGVQEIGYLQAWGLFILCNILFKSTAKMKE